MHLPRTFEETRSERLLALIHAHPFATVVVNGEDAPVANALPLMMSARGTLQGHVARANALSRADGMGVLAIFHGPQAHVSANWYPSRLETGRVVPTWNYAVVQVQGRLQVVEDPAWLGEHLQALVQRQETGGSPPWRMDDAPADYIAQEMRGIVGLEIEITAMRGKFKLSQNHPEANRKGVIAGLRNRARGDDLALADLMQELGEGSP